MIYGPFDITDTEIALGIKNILAEQVKSGENQDINILSRTTISNCNG